MKAPIIRIAAAVIDDGDGRILLVRKAGTAAFMQAGGKIEADEEPLTALRRELCEELALDLPSSQLNYLGCFIADAANEPDHRVEAELFHLRATFLPKASAEIAEVRWVTLDEALSLSLAPLTRQHVLPLAVALAR
jgi:8-oxo-dGTP pyrophosphatase MutT (NUDIX family)